MEVIDVNRKILTENRQVEILEDVIVPDVKPDVISIIGVNGIAYSYRQEQTNGKIKLDGNVDCYIVYLSSNGDTRSIQTTLNFGNYIENNMINETATLKYEIKIKNIEAKLLNERKISITANLDIEYKIYQRQKLEFFNDFDSIDDLQKQEEELTVNSLIGIGIAKTSLKEDVKLPDLDNVQDILKVNIETGNSECKISYNKVLAKNEAKISIIYLTEDERIAKVSANFPVMSFIEIENVKEDNVCNVDYKIKNILFKNNGKEEHSITVQIEYEIMCEAYESKKIQLVRDLYSLKNDLDYTSKEFDVDVNDNENSGYPLKIDEKVEIENIKQVFDVEANVNILKNTSNNLEGEARCKIYYETTDKNGLNIKEIVFPFISKVSGNTEFITKLVKSEFDVDENEVILQLECELIPSNNSSKKLIMIENVKVNENKIDEDYSVVIYFVKQNDNIWKIAKKFKVTMDSIVKINNLDNLDMIHPGDKLYIMK